MGEIVSYDPYNKKFSFNSESRWAETILAVMNANNIIPAAKLVFSNIILNIKQQPLRFPSQQELAKAADSCDRTVRRHIQQLKDLQLIAVPEKCGRVNKYVIREYTDTAITFSPQAEKYLKNLLNVKVAPFSVTEDKNVLKDKNVLTEQEKEEKKEEEKKERSKERKEEDKREERECAPKSADISFEPDSHLSLAEKRQAALSEKKNKAASRELFESVETKRSLIKGDLPIDVSKWTPLHFEKYFSDCFRKTFDKDMLQQYAKNRTILKKAIKEQGLERVHMKEVIDFVFQNWEELTEKMKLVVPLPSIGFVFSGYYESLSSLQKAGFSSHSFKNVRSDFEVDFKLSDKQIES